MGEFCITRMSDDFIKIATKEIGEDISELEKILSLCATDTDIIYHASSFQKYTHKIKGLAPMMGKEDLGYVSSSLDTFFKIILKKSNIDGAFEIIRSVILSMNSMLVEPNYDVVEIKQRISQLESILN